MKLNIANPSTGAQQKVEIDEEKRIQCLMDKRMAEEIEGDLLGDEFKGYVFKITGGNDKDGFPMRQGVLVNKRVRLLLRRGMPCYKAGRKGERKRKAVRGCIIGPDIAALNLIIVKQGDNHLSGLTDKPIARRLGPKRVDKIRKMFNLSKEDDPRDYVVRRKVTTKNGNKITKKPKIQRLVTSTIRHRRNSLKKRVVNRKQASYDRRKAYFEGLTKKAAKAQSKINKAKAVKNKQQKQKNQKNQKGSAKKGGNKKGSAKKNKQGGKKNKK